MSNNDELIAQFIEISGGDENVARFYLASSNWSLEDALSNFLGNQVDGDSGGEDTTNGRNTGGETVEPLPTNSSGRERPEPAADSFTRKSSERPKVATLNDMSKQSPNDEEQGQAFYAGGSERSGQQVLGPPKRKNFREQLTDMFRMAHAHEHSSGESAGPSTSTGVVQWGQGVRLGMTDSDHSVVTPLPAQADGNNATEEKKPVVVLKLWSQGFSIDDGELRLYDDPDNKEFLETVMRGEIPHELLEMGWLVNVDVEDHRHEDYKIKSTMPKFKGSGHTLGSPTPNIEGAADPCAEAAATTSAAPSTATSTPDVNKDVENTAKDKLKLDASQPTTTLQIRLADGSRLTAQFNLSHTVADIIGYIMNARPQYANASFRLVSSFPTRELTDAGATIETAGLRNASLMQRMN